MEKGTKFKSVDEYFNSFPEDTRHILEQIRKTVQYAAPQATEVISYNMPAIKLNGVLVYYAAYQDHIGFYPTASGIESFKKDFSEYKWSKGAVQFPIGRPMPLDLIAKIVRFRLQEAIAKENKKAQK